MTPKKSLPFDKERIIEDYRIAYKSRKVSEIGRREVLSGRAKFGIFGDGKEVTQLAMAHAFKPGDWRSGYRRCLAVERYRCQAPASCPAPRRQPGFRGQLLSGREPPP